jgi:flagellar basal-body rod protein FlgC
MSVFDIALSGMAAATARLNVTAQNVANTDTVGPVGSAPNSPGPAAPPAYAPLQLVQFSTPISEGGGVETAVQTSANPTSTAYDPSSAYANAQGLVADPNVDLAMEAVNQIEAITQFKASLNVIKTGDEMLRAALKLTV